MAKEAIKERAAKRQDGKSISGADLPLDEKGKLIHPLTDTHRAVSKAEGGTYRDQEIPVMLPTEHRDLHGNKPWLDDPELIELRAIMEDYRTCVKLRVKINNHKLAIERGMDELTPEIDELFAVLVDEIAEREKLFKKRAEKQLKEVKMPIIPILLNLKGVGPIITAELVTLIDITKARYPSSLWKHVGYHVAYDQRYIPGEKGGGHKHLRSVMYNLGVSFLRAGNEAYREVYDRRKAKTENSHKEVMHVQRLKGENGKNVVTKKLTAWKDVNPGRRHNDGLRVMNKNFLADLWFVWRELEGLPTADLYVKEHLGHESAIINPRERGWEY